MNVNHVGIDIVSVPYDPLRQIYMSTFTTMPPTILQYFCMLRKKKKN